MKKLLIWLLISILTIGPLAAEARYALVIGNGSYKGISPLRNPANDAVDIASVLRQLDFDVDVLVDSNLREMRSGVRELHRQLQADPESIGLFYFAGHGVQSQGNNYLVPVDADILTETDLEYEALSANYVLDYLNESESSFNFIVLDACRDNPYSTFRSTSRGLAVVNAPKGSIVMYATGAGEVAADGTGRNGTFTESLLNYLGTPGIPVTEMVRMVMGDVSASTDGSQVPAFYSNYFGDFSFNSEGLGASSVQPRVMSSTVRPELIVPKGIALNPIEPVTSGIERLPGGATRPRVTGYFFNGTTYPTMGTLTPYNNTIFPAVLNEIENYEFSNSYTDLKVEYEEKRKKTMLIFNVALFAGIILIPVGMVGSLMSISYPEYEDYLAPSLGGFIGAIGGMFYADKKLQTNYNWAQNELQEFVTDYNTWLKNNN